MNLKRFGHILICLVLICAILLSISPLKVKAASEIVAIKAAAVTLVNTNPLILAAAGLVCLGVMAHPDTQDVFMEGASVVAESVEAFGSAVYRVVTDTGEVLTYVTADLLETIRGAALDAGIIYNQAVSYSAGDTVTMMNGDTLVVNETCHKVQFVGKSSGIWSLYEYVFSDPGANLTYYLNGSESLSQGSNMKASDTSSYRVYTYSETISALEASNYPSIGVYNVDYTSSTAWRIVRCFENGLLGMTVSEGYSCGVIPSVPVDGSSALKWSEEYGSRQLRLVESSGGSSGDNPDNTNQTIARVLLPLALAGTASGILAMTQSDQWSADTLTEIPDAATNTEFEILDTPEIDGFPGVEVSPVTNPDTGGDSGADTGGDTGTDTGGDTGVNSGTTSGGIEGDDYLSEKVAALRSRFAFADSIISTIQFLANRLRGLGAKPPIIYIDLGASEGSYYLGEKIVFMDLSWYAKYKPAGDAIISAFLWWFFLWKLFVKLPGIIGGLPGDWVASVADKIGVSDIASRSKDLEEKRQSHRQSVNQRRKNK